MTLQEAKQEIDTCELKITDAYSSLKDAARGMGSGTFEAVRERPKSILSLIYDPTDFMREMVRKETQWLLSKIDEATEI